MKSHTRVAATESRCLNQDAPGGEGVDHAERQRKFMSDMITQGGLTPLDAAKIILEGIAAQQFWVSTHPEMTAFMARERADYLANLKTPALAEGARQILKS